MPWTEKLLAAVDFLSTCLCPCYTSRPAWCHCRFGLCLSASWSGSREPPTASYKAGSLSCGRHLTRERNPLSNYWKVAQTSIGQWSSKVLEGLACENIRFSSLYATGDVSRGGTSATQRQKFDTDDVDQCLYNKSGSHGVPNTNLSNFTCLSGRFW